MNEKQHEKTIKLLTEKLDQQQGDRSNSIKGRDKKLMQTFNEIMDSKNELSEVENKKGLFARLFGK